LPRFVDDYQKGEALSVRRRDAFLNAAYRGAASLLSGSDAGAALFGASHKESTGDIGISSRAGRSSLNGNGNSGTNNSSGDEGPLKRRLLSPYTIVERPARPTQEEPLNTKRFEVQVRGQDFTGIVRSYLGTGANLSNRSLSFGLKVMN
jgi:hypothetical protein